MGDLWGINNKYKCRIYPRIIFTFMLTSDQIAHDYGVSVKLVLIDFQND